MRNILVWAVALVLVATQGWAQDLTDHVAIIVNKANPIETLSMQDLRQIFLAERLRWENGRLIKVGMRKPGRPERAVVLQQICGMSERDFARYFLQAVFTGAVQAAPKRFASAAGIRTFRKGYATPEPREG